MRGWVAAAGLYLLTGCTTSYLRLPEFSVVSHMGHGYGGPSNSLAGIQRCIEQQVDGVEIDVQTTKDNVPVLWHDDTLLRLTGKKTKIADYTLAELQKIRLRNKETIPTLEQVVNLGETNWFIHVKDAYLQPAVDIIAKYDLFKRSYLLITASTHYAQARELKEEYPELRLVYKVSDIEDIPVLQKLFPGEIARVNYRPEKELLMALEEANITTLANIVPVLPQGRQIAFLLQHGVDIIQTDNPELLQRIKGEP